jgi:RNA polymerase subunit RPABC4/transcription elongation factor Spt4
VVQYHCNALSEASANSYSRKPPSPGLTGVDPYPQQTRLCTNCRYSRKLNKLGGVPQPSPSWVYIPSGKGNPRGAREKSALTEEHTQEQQEELSCPNCGAQLPDEEANFCPKCGTELPQESAQFCSNCGEELPEEEVNFCPKCGAEQQVQEEEVTNEEPAQPSDEEELAPRRGRLEGPEGPSGEIEGPSRRPSGPSGSISGPSGPSRRPSGPSGGSSRARRAKEGVERAREGVERAREGVDRAKEGAAAAKERARQAKRRAQER